MAKPPPFVSRKEGNRRLLRLAKILDTVDAKHRRKKEPTYNQRIYVHDCGTPACALGHWAAANPKRWRKVHSDPGRIKLRANYGGAPGLLAAQDDFGLSFERAEHIFSGAGCGNAKTAKQAARYIRQYVKAFLQ